MFRTLAIAGIFLVGPAFVPAYAEGMGWSAKLPNTASFVSIDRA